MNPIVVRLGLLLFVALSAFGVGLFVMRRLRQSLVAEQESLGRVPMTVEGLPAHAYHAVIQQLKQQKQELAAQHLSDRRKAKASDSLSSTILSNLSCGVLFFDTRGLLRQANSAARTVLGFASPVGLHIGDIFRTASPRPDMSGTPIHLSVEQALAEVLAGKSTVRGLAVNYFSREGTSQILEVTASPVLGEDASLMGMSVVLNDKTDIEQIRHDQRTRDELYAEVGLGLRHSVKTIAELALQLASDHDSGRAHQLADGISHEAERLDQTLGSFLGGARKATTSS